MAKNAVKVSDGINKVLLAQIVSGAVQFVSQPDGSPLLSHNPPLIEVNLQSVDPTDATKVACRATPAGIEYLSKHETKVEKVAEASKYSIITNAVLPEANRRGNQSGSGAPAKYPFADLPVGGSFFSANGEHSKGDAVKALGSTVSAQNNKYSKPTGEKKTVTRAVRDPKTHKAVLNADGHKQTETVELDVKAYERKFTIRPVKSGEKYGEWTAPADGALVGRIK